MPTSPSNQPLPMPAIPFWRRWGGWVIGGGIALLVIAVLWYLLAGTASTRRAAPETAMLMLPPPPPPPPEPEKLPEPEPEKIEPQITEVEPTPVEPLDNKPLDDAQPSPAPDAGDPVTMNADAQAGVGGVLVGRGGGSTGGGGGGMGDGFYGRYISMQLQQELARDPRTRNLAFSDIRIDIWLAADGRATRVQLAQGTGDARIDDAVMDMVRRIGKFDERPPQSMRFPMRVSMRGTRTS